MGRGGKLEIDPAYVRLADTEKAAIRAVKGAKGGSLAGGMTAGIAVTELWFFPAAPFFSFMVEEFDGAGKFSCEPIGKSGSVRRLRGDAL